MTRTEIISVIIAYFEENENVFDECIEELDSYNGYLGEDRYYYMEELDELYCGVEATELLRCAFYGYDEDNYTTDNSGNRTYGAFNPNRQYFTFNGYGNLVSADYKDYSEYLGRYTVEALAENRAHLWTITDDAELDGLFDRLEEAEEE